MTKSTRHHPSLEDNKIYPEDKPVHEWYRFVLSYPPHLVRQYLDRFDVKPDERVLDPFCGTGTTLVEAKKRGIASAGIEANKIARFASAVKVDWDPDPDRLLEHAVKIVEAATNELDQTGIRDAQFFSPQPDPSVKLKSLPSATGKLLLKNSISPLPLHKTLVLLECLERQKDIQFYAHERLALGRTLVKSIGNLRFGPEVGVGKVKKDTPVLQPWLATVRSIANDLRQVKNGTRNGAAAQVYEADARTIAPGLPDNSIDAVITSPPYPNEKDYTRTTRLESVLLGFVKNRAELRSLKKELVRSNTRGVYKNDEDDKWISDHPEIGRIADAIEERRIELGKTSGFERMYPRVTKLYFGGMARHFAELRRVLRAGARLAYVVGDQASYLRIMIRTGSILSKIAESLGYEVESLDLFRTRFATATGEELREEVLVLRWPG